MEIDSEETWTLINTVTRSMAKHGCSATSITHQTHGRIDLAQQHSKKTCLCAMGFNWDAQRVICRLYNSFSFQNTFGQEGKEIPLSLQPSLLTVMWTGCCSPYGPHLQPIDTWQVQVVEATPFIWAHRLLISPDRNRCTNGWHPRGKKICEPFLHSNSVWLCVGHFPRAD